jgi:RluA family pseudouridine synthase
MREPPAADELELRSRVPPHAAGARLLDYLLQRFPYHDRDAWRREIDAGRLRLGNRVLTAEARLPAGGQLVYRRVHREPPVDDRIEVLHADGAIVVVRKPAHLPMHADGPFVRHTLIHLVRTRLQAPQLQLVHRLDRETSGVCVLAHSAAVRERLRRQFAAGTVHKAYLAVVRGAAADDFVCDLPIGRAAGSAVALRRAAGAGAVDAKPARTTVTVLRRGPARALVRCVPQTGRTHQVRVHLEAMALPVLGDKLYGRPDADYLRFVARVKAGQPATATDPDEPDRQLLHAEELTFDHPATGERTSYRDDMPAEFAPWLADTAPVP